MTAPPKASLRADALRNRTQIVTAATAAFADENVDVPMEDLARLAGVGVGTLYRRFPDRAALILAVIQDSLRTVLTKARAAAAAEPRAWDALARSMDHSSELKLVLRLSSSISAETETTITADPVIEQVRTELMGVIDGLVRAAQTEGSLRPDVTTADVVYVFSLLLRAAPSASDVTAASAFDRARALVLDGLRSTNATNLPGRPPPQRVENLSSKK